MNEEQRIVFIQSQIVCANAKIEGMKAENEVNLNMGLPPDFVQADFENVPVEFGLTHNQVIEFLRGY